MLKDAHYCARLPAYAGPTKAGVGRSNRLGRAILSPRRQSLGDESAIGREAAFAVHAQSRP